MKTTNPPEQLTIMAGQDVRTSLPADTRRQLAQAYFKLYFGLSWLNWMGARQSLGMAWQRALTQVDAFIGAKDDRNPAAQYLHQVHAKHKRQWPRHIMTHAGRDRRLNIPADKADAWRVYGQRRIDSALGTISLIMARHQIKEQQQAAVQEELKETTVTRDVIQQNVTTREIEQVHIKHVYVGQVHTMPVQQKVAARAPTTISRAVAQSVSQPAARPMAPAQATSVAQVMGRVQPAVVAKPMGQVQPVVAAQAVKRAYIVTAARPNAVRMAAAAQSIEKLNTTPATVMAPVAPRARPVPVRPASPLRPMQTVAPRLVPQKTDARPKITVAAVQPPVRARNMFLMFNRINQRAA